MNQSRSLADIAQPSAGIASMSPVRLLAAGEEARWDAYVLDHPDGTFFHLSGWRAIFEEVLGHRTYYLLCERGGVTEALLPLVHVKSLLFGNSLISLPFLVYGGPLSGTQAAEDALVNRARELAHELEVDYLEMRNREALHGDWHLKDRYVTFRKEIDPDPEKNLLAIPRKQRAMVRKGINAGLTTEFDQDTNRMHRALLECKRNLGTPFFGADYLRAITAAFGDRVQVATVTHDSVTVCSVMSFRYGNQILPYYGGGGKLARELYGNDFMYWAVMEQACRQGVKIFDYGRSMINSGAYRFKKHWGFEPTPLAYQFYLVRAKEVPQIDPTNPRFQMLVKLWQRLPLGLAGLIGPPLARRLG